MAYLWHHRPVGSTLHLWIASSWGSTDSQNYHIHFASSARSSFYVQASEEPVPSNDVIDVIIDDAIYS